MAKRGGRWEGGPWGRVYVYTCIHSHLWTAKTNTHCKRITLQLKKKNLYLKVNHFLLPPRTCMGAKRRASSESPRGAADPAAPLPQLLHLVGSEPKAAWSVPSRGYAKGLVTKLTQVLESESTGDIHAIGSLRLLFHSLRRSAAVLLGWCNLSCAFESSQILPSAYRFREDS